VHPRTSVHAQRAAVRQGRLRLPSSLEYNQGLSATRVWGITLR